MRHFLTLKDYTKEEIHEMIDLGLRIKAEVKGGRFTPYLQNQTLAMIFEKSSTRTRVSFEVGMYQLGGAALFLSSRDIQLGRGEPMKDTARVIGRMCDMVMIRTYGQEKLEEFAKFSPVPVINGLTDLYHPVQLMADYVGDGNNMAHSWLMLASKLGFELRVATPKGYECDPEVVADALEFAKESGATILFTDDPKEAVAGADVVTTDTWVSMGDEDEKEKRLRDFAGYTVDEEMMKRARADAIFLHCLPAYRGLEVTEEVIEGPQSVVFDEAENRLHAQKGVMVWLDGKRNEA